MTRSRLRLLPAVALLLFLIQNGLVSFAQSNVSVDAEVDKITLAADDLLTLTVTVGGEYQQLDEPELPSLSGFRIVSSSRSSQFSMVNGMVTSHTAFTYRLQPSEPGSFILDPIAIVADGATHWTEPITIKVTATAPPHHSPEPAVSSDFTAPPLGLPQGLTGQDLYVEADVSNASPIIGQQIIYRLRFYQAVNLPGQPSLEWPGFDGFWSQSLAPNSVYEQDAAGRLYRVTEVRQALFPTIVGPTSIEPATLTIPGDILGRETTLETKAVSVDVKPFPDGPPEGFTGAVGQFDITAWIDPEEGRVNDPMTLFVQVSGTGNLTAIPDPTDEIENAPSDWRLYDSQVTTNLSQDGDNIVGEKLFERLLVPRIDGTLAIPSLSIVYYDPERGEYRTAQTAPLTIQVAQGDNGVDDPSARAAVGKDTGLLASDVRHIKPAPASLSTRRARIFAQPAYWAAWIVPLLATVGVWFWDRRRRLSNDAACTRYQRAERLARRELSRARNLARSDQRAAYASINRAVTGYISDKLDVSRAGLTRDAIRRALVQCNVPVDLIDRTLECIDRADMGRFSPVVVDEDVSELVDTTATVIADLEATIRKVDGGDDD